MLDKRVATTSYPFPDKRGCRMKYYVVADIHGFYTELKQALTEKGFFSDTLPHKLIICGDIMDRGGEAIEVQQFILDLMDKNQVILIRGNHEDLMMDIIYNWENKSYMFAHHISNKTTDTILQLTNATAILPDNCDHVKEQLLNTPFIKKIIPSMIKYYETKHYIFVHGWIPCYRFLENGVERFEVIDNWRTAEPEDWYFARWTNGMAAWKSGVRETGKTIVCGHWNCSYGHSVIEHKGSQYGEDADHSPFYGDGIIAIDACTALSKKINCIIVEDDN